MPMKKIYLAGECFFLFGLIPGSLIWIEIMGNVPFFPLLLGMLLLTVCITAFDKSMHFQIKSGQKNIQSFRKQFFLKIIITGFFLCGFTALFYPNLLFAFPRERTGIWLMVMILYPLLSVVPQEFLFRTFFMQRYESLFGHKNRMLWMNALVFAWAHMVFLNSIAPVFSLAGGLLMAKTWQQTKSFRWVCLEHALYGQLVFTSGIGWVFYQGSTRSLENVSLTIFPPDFFAFSFFSPFTSLLLDWISFH